LQEFSSHGAWIILKNSGEKFYRIIRKRLDFQVISNNLYRELFARLYSQLISDIFGDDDLPFCVSLNYCHVVYPFLI
jgi:hypothetical protein